MALDPLILSSKYKKMKRKRGSKDFSFSRFSKIVKEDFELIQKCIENKFDRNTLLIARNNYVVNSITALEVYFKDVIISTTAWKESGYTKLFKEKITLGDAFHLFGSEKITRQFVIAQTTSLKNFDAINFTMSCLTDVDFYKEIEKYKIEWDEKEHSILIEDYPDWRKDLVTCFEVRNAFVHDRVLSKLNNDDIESLYFLLSDFVISVESYLDDVVEIYKE